jgi:hypothetical protein
MSRFHESCRKFLKDFLDRRVLDKGGRGMSAAGGATLRRRPLWMERGFGLAAAVLLDSGGPDGRLPAAEVLANCANRVIDACCRELTRHCVGRVFPPNFDMLTLVPAMELLLPRASAGRRRLWLRAAEACARVSRDFLLAKEAAWGKPGPYTGCGPNHLFIISGSLYRLGRLLGEERHCRLARRAMHRLCELQSPEGYFPENSGPVVGYQRVSLLGLCDYRRTSGDRFVDPFVARGIGYVGRAMYPNLTGIETLDQRNRGGLRVGRPGARPTPMDVCFGLDPVGRLLAERAVAGYQAALDERPEGVSYHVAGLVALGGLLYVDGPVARLLPSERRAFVDRLEGKAVIVRRDRWMLVLSAYEGSNRPGNPYILDRTQSLSLYHDRFGLVIGGGNDKHNLGAATFEVVESDCVRYFPPVGGSVRAAGRRGRLDLDYGAARARLTATVRSAREVRLVAGLCTNFAEQTSGLNLQIPIGPGAVVRIDGRRVRLSSKATETRTWRVRRRFEPAPGVRLELPGGGEFRWPVLPWNSYNSPTHTSKVGAATGYLRLPLSGRDLAERVVRITAAD